MLLEEGVYEATPGERIAITVRLNKVIDVVFAEMRLFYGIGHQDIYLHAITPTVPEDDPYVTLSGRVPSTASSGRYVASTLIVVERSGIRRAITLDDRASLRVKGIEGRIIDNPTPVSDIAATFFRCGDVDALQDLAPEEVTDVRTASPANSGVTWTNSVSAVAPAVDAKSGSNGLRRFWFLALIAAAAVAVVLLSWIVLKASAADPRLDNMAQDNAAFSPVSALPAVSEQGPLHISADDIVLGTHTYHAWTVCDRPDIEGRVAFLGRALMHATDVAPDSAIFIPLTDPQDEHVRINMADENANVDVVFADANGRVGSVVSYKADVDSGSVFGYGRYVVALAGGEAARAHIAPGSRLQFSGVCEITPDAFTGA